jgi:putative transposase
VTVAGFIVAQRARHRVAYATSCRAVGVSQAWSYKWRHGDRSPQHARRAQLTAAIKQIFAARHGKYGSPRITGDLREAGWRVSAKTVAKIMREQRLVARAKRRRRSMTRQGKGRWRAPDLVGRNFPASTVNQKWYGDGTEIVTDEGKLFLLDLGHGLPTHRRIRDRRASRRRAGSRGAGDGRRDPRREGRDRRGDHAHR